MRWESRRFDSFSVYSVCPCGPLAGCRAVTWLLQWGGWQKEANSLLYIPDACVWCSVLKLFWETSTNIQWSLFIYVSAGTFHTQHVSLDVTPAKTFSAAPRLQASSFFVAVSNELHLSSPLLRWCILSSCNTRQFSHTLGDIFIKPPGCGSLHADSYLNRQTGNFSLRHSALSTLKGCEQVKMKKPHFLLTCMNQIVINTGLAGKTQPLEYLLMISSLL